MVTGSGRNQNMLNSSKMYRQVTLSMSHIILKKPFTLINKDIAERN